MRLGSLLSRGTICLALDAVRLVTGIGPLRLIETFCTGMCPACIAEVRPIPISLTLCLRPDWSQLLLLFCYFFTVKQNYANSICLSQNDLVNEKWRAVVIKTKCVMSIKTVH